MTDDRVSGENEEGEQKSVPSSWEMLRHPVILTNFIVIHISFCAVSFNFYFMNFYMKYIKGDIYLNSILSALSCVLAQVVTPIMTRKISFRVSFIIQYGLATVAALPLLFVNASETSNAYLIPLSVFVSRFGIASAFASVFAAQSALFPSIFVTVAFGSSSGAAHLISILAPQIAELTDPVPMLVYLGLGTSACIAHFFQKDIKDKEAFYQELVRQKTAKLKESKPLLN